MDHNPDTSRRLTGEQKIQLIDSMRNKGSYEAARERLTATARIIATASVRPSRAKPGNSTTIPTYNSLTETEHCATSSPRISRGGRSPTA